MYHHIEYRTLTNPKMRLVRRTDGAIWDAVNSQLATSPTYANTAITLTRNDNINGIPITLPSLLPAGEYDMLIYDVVIPSKDDEAAVIYRIRWSGNGLGYPVKQVLEI